MDCISRTGRICLILLCSGTLLNAASNALDLAIYPNEEERIALELSWSTEFTNQVEFYASSQLTSNDWWLISAPLPTLGESNLIWVVPLEDEPSGFFRAGNADQDSDGDGLPDAREWVVSHTSITNTDSDYDLLPDGFEVEWGFEPMVSNNAMLDAESDGLWLWSEFLSGCNPLTNDSDGDGLLDGFDPYPSSWKPQREILTPKASALVTSMPIVVSGSVFFKGEDVMVFVGGDPASVVGGANNWEFEAEFSPETNGLQTIDIEAIGARYGAAVRNGVTHPIEVRHFEPKLTVLSPRNGAEFDSKFLHITVLSDQMDPVTAKGVMMTRDGYVNYAWVELTPGANTIPIVSSGSAGVSETDLVVICNALPGETERAPVDRDMDGVWDYKDPAPDDPSISSRIVVEWPPNGMP